MISISSVWSFSTVPSAASASVPFTLYDFVSVYPSAVPLFSVTVYFPGASPSIVFSYLSPLFISESLYVPISVPFESFTVKLIFARSSSVIVSPAKLFVNSRLPTSAFFLLDTLMVAAPGRTANVMSLPSASLFLLSASVFTSSALEPLSSVWKMK